MSKFRCCFPRILGLFIGLLCFSASHGISQSKAPDLASLTPEQLKATVIKFERTGCYGNCPAYRLTIFGDGRVEYEGIRDVKITSKQKGAISEADLRSMLAGFVQAKFLSIGDNVGEQKCSCTYCTDMPSVFTEITIGNFHYRVDHYYGCSCASKELFALEKSIDQLSRSDHWTGDVSKAGPNGTTCFDRGKSN